MASKIQTIKVLKKLWVLSAVFFRFSNGSTGDLTRLADLEKHQTPEFLLMNDFYDFEKNTSFSSFSDIFENNQRHILYHCMHYVNILDQTEYNLISPFLTVILSKLVSTSGFNVNFKGLNDIYQIYF